MSSTADHSPPPLVSKPFTFIDLFSGIGGFHLALSRLGGRCVFASDIDARTHDLYVKNFGLRPSGDIWKIALEDIPAHDVLAGGFPCFAKGTLVCTAAGYRPIEELRAGDLVLTHKNRWRPVQHVMQKDNAPLHLIRSQCDIHTTAEHPFYARTRKTAASKPTPPRWSNAKSITKRSLLATPIPENGVQDVHSKEFWYVLEIGRASCREREEIYV